MSAAVSPIRLQIASSESVRECDEATVYQHCLPLAGARILELGCGTAAHTIAIASHEPSVSITAYEIDAIQHHKNKMLTAPPNILFKFGRAQAIAEPDSTFEIVMMFKSLHHVPLEQLDQVFEEIARVLKPGGLVYLSEPIFAGPFNELLRLFHDEEHVRRAAFEATCRAVSSGKFSSVEEIFFTSPVRFEDFADFEHKVINVTHSNHQLDVDLYNLVKKKFEQSQSPDGVQFSTPMRVNVLKKRS
jgi:ubiquinone/menaquinone biosynthesis C-methylase UbiE